MRRTLALVIALPVMLATLTSMGSSAAVDEAAPAPALEGAPVAAAVPSPSPAPSPPPEGAPAGDGSGDAAPTTDDAGTQADAEGTVTQDDASAAGPEIGPPPPPRAERTDPIEATFLVAAVPEAGAVAGTGNRWRYTIEVEPGLDIDPEQLAIDVRAALNDERSWARNRTLEQVGDPTQARIRVVLASPETVDELCGRAGLRTAGIYSCWNGRFAALNSWRWEVGADGFPDITTYRNYLVNHEFGHGLGYGHVGCPAAGALAPVMMQQSKGLGDCVANGWPYP